MNPLNEKLDSKSQIQLALGELTDDLMLLLKVEKELTKKQKKCLEDDGCVFLNTTGKIVVAKSSMEALEQIAKHAFIKRIEISKDLYLEDKADVDQAETE